MDTTNFALSDRSGEGRKITSMTSSPKNYSEYKKKLFGNKSKLSLPKVDENMKGKILAISKQSQERIMNLKAATAMSHFGTRINRKSDNFRFDNTMKSGDLSLLN
jgi:tRNA(Leu) C34 or U34 (ribose-2'-O)-methylase TrmL